ncbi:MAG TPA: acetyl-CoA carboxylase biotin carboxyl carrier protein [bacterium]
MRSRDVEKLIRIVQESDIAELEITDFWGRRIRISKTAGVKGETGMVPGVVVTQASESAAAAAKLAEKTSEEKTEKKNVVAIRSPIVGSFYRSPAPDAPPYVEVGDTVKPGQVVCIVEAMKLMNEIESDIAGKVAKILVKNEEAVEYNQELFLIEPL